MLDVLTEFCFMLFVFQITIDLLGPNMIINRKAFP